MLVCDVGVELMDVKIVMFNMKLTKKIGDT